MPRRRGDHRMVDGDKYEIVGWGGGLNRFYYNDSAVFSSRSLKPQAQIDASLPHSPIVRNPFTAFRVSDIVSVQPMTLPVGKLFYQNYTYGYDDIDEDKDPDADA